ncbi:hypothetical protein B0H19DRAFT_431944 [Mycena capillaripes]|nr:hypothetical protein B0H19DRAFT_431944 [Mycena capillaripes]
MPFFPTFPFKTIPAHIFPGYPPYSRLHPKAQCVNASQCRLVERVHRMQRVYHETARASAEKDPPTTHHCVRASIPPRTLSHRRRPYSMAAPHSTRLKRILCAVLSPYPIAQRPCIRPPALDISLRGSIVEAKRCGRSRIWFSQILFIHRFRCDAFSPSCTPLIRHAQLRKFGPV